MNVKNCYQYCSVPCCGNTTIKTPTKLFIRAPKTDRNKWLELARINVKHAAKTKLTFCEDHFDLPNDMENYMQYHLLGSVGRVLLKPKCLPSKFACQPDRKKRTTTTPRAAYLKRQRKDIVEQLLQDEKETKEVAMDNTHLLQHTRASSTAIRAKISDAQVDILCTFFEENPEVIKGYKKTPGNRRKVKDKWIKVTPLLNSLGAARNPETWSKYLNHLKTKLKKQRIEWKETSDGPVICDAEDYSELKLRMLQVLKEDHPDAQDESNTRLEETSINFKEENSNYEEEESEDVEQQATTTDNSISSEQQSSHIFMNDNGYGDEFDWFGKNVAQQLRTLPLQVALETQELVLSVIRKQRLEVLNNSNNCDPLER